MIETASNFEQNQQLYRNIYETINESELSAEQRREILLRYNEERDMVHDQTSRSFSILSDDVLTEKKDVFLALRRIFENDRQELRKLQTLAGVSVDGLIGPETFAGFLRLISRFNQLVGMSPEEVLDHYDNIYTEVGDTFSNKGVLVRREIQVIIGTHPDGIFGPNTFYALMQNWDEIEDHFPQFVVEAEDIHDEDSISEDEVLENGDIGVDGDGEILSGQELQEKLIEDASSISSTLISLIQLSVGVGVDGTFGPQSAQAVIDSFPEAQSLDDVLDYLNINSEGDVPLSDDGSPEVFRDQYNPFIIELARQFNIPVGLIDSIIGRETDYGANLLHSGGSKGMMQLTNVIFEDMRQPGRRERIFRPLFQEIDIENLSQIELGDGTSASDGIPGPILDLFAILSDPQVSDEIFDEHIIILQNYLKGDANYFNHLTNMIVGSLWLTYHYNRSNGNIFTTARNYNGNPALRDAYGRDVAERFNSYEIETYPSSGEAQNTLNQQELSSAVSWIESRVSEFNIQRLALYFEIEREDNPDFLTELAQFVAQYQSQNSLTVDGKPGPQTLGTIDFSEINIQLLPEDRGEFISSLPEQWQEIGLRFVESLRPDESLTDIQSLQLFDPRTRRGFVRLPTGDSEIPILCGRGATLRNTVHRVNQIIITDSPHGDASNGANSNTVRAASFMSDIAGTNGGKWAPHGVDRYRVTGDYSSMQTLGCIGIESSLMHQIAQETIANTDASPIGREVRTLYRDGTRGARAGTTGATRYSIPSGRVFTYTA